MKLSQYAKQNRISQELIDAYIFYYGGSKKNATLQLASYSEDGKRYLLERIS